LSTASSGWLRHARATRSGASGVSSRTDRAAAEVGNSSVFILKKPSGGRRDASRRAVPARVIEAGRGPPAARVVHLDLRQAEVHARRFARPRRRLEATPGRVALDLDALVAAVREAVDVERAVAEDRIPQPAHALIPGRVDAVHAHEQCDHVLARAQARRDVVHVDALVPDRSARAAPDALGVHEQLVAAVHRESAAPRRARQQRRAAGTGKAVRRLVALPAAADEAAADRRGRSAAARSR
jgi:hypothetical protein